MAFKESSSENAEEKITLDKTEPAEMKEEKSQHETRSREGVLDVLTAQDAKDMLIYIAEKVIAEKPYLTEIDSAIGDGDHGIGTAGGMQKAREKLEKLYTGNAYEVFEAAGKAMLMSMGGASGVIFGSLYPGERE